MRDGRRVAGAALLLLPAGLVVFLAFNSGGFFPGPPAYVAVLLCVVLAVRVAAAGSPFDGAGVGMVTVTAALALYALLTLLSQIWSHAPGRALVEFDRALVYLLLVVLFGTVARSRERLRWLLRTLALAIIMICACGLITRLLPHLWPTNPGLANNRLSFPLTYWNALGLLGALGVVLCLHLSSDAREWAAVRVCAAAAVPVLATTIYFTFSRGGIAAAVIGTVLYVLIARPKAVLSTAVAVLPTTAVAIKFAYDANLLATPDPTTSAAVSQGKHVAVAVLCCVLVAATARWLLVLGLDGRLEAFTLARHIQTRVRRVGWGTLGAATLIAAIALNGTIAHQYRRFVSPAPPGSASDLRTRLSDPGNNGRIELWRVGWHQFPHDSVLGHGAGTFANTWAQFRPNQDFVLDAHSLYIETLDELGIVGFLLLVGVIVAVLIGTAAQARGGERPMYAAVFTVMLLWGLHAGVDWDWEMPAITVPFFALGGFMLSRPLTHVDEQEGAALPVERPYARIVLGVACVLLAVAPAYVWLSQRRLDQASAAFAQGNCQSATQSALSSLSILGDRPEPYEVISYCDIRRDMPGLAIATIQKAISLDPNNWNFQYDLAVMRASAGLDPMPALRRAVLLNRHDPLIREAVQTFRGENRAQWERDGKSIASQLITL